MMNLALAGLLMATACSTASEPTNTLGSEKTAVSAPSITLAVASSTTATTVRFNPSIVIVGPEEPVFDWSEDQCRTEHHPDLPALAFRDSDGLVSLIISSPTIHRMTGPDLDSVKVDCDPIRFSTVDPDPGNYDFRGWMGSLYTEDGEIIHAIIHNEFHGDEASFAHSRRDFSDVQGAGDWSYLGRIGATVLELDFQEIEWRRGETLCIVSDWGAHPSNDCQAIRRWTAPETGDVSIWASVADAGIGGGNGVEVGVSHNGAEVWTHMLEEGDAAGTEINLDLSVESGDTIDFWVDSLDDASFDATTISVEINYGERPCTVGDRDLCQMIALTYSQSTDGGATFSTAEPPDHLVAAVPERYIPDAGLFGLWQPSNIVKHPDDGYYYMLAQLDIHKGPRNVTGECLLRTDDLGDASSWRAWDGDSFDYVFLDPYRDDISDAEQCASVVEAPMWSLTYNTYLERFVGLTENQFRTPQGVYFRTSSDLIHWDQPRLVVGSPDWTIGFANNFQTPFEAYPSILDPESESMSFDTVGEKAYLYFTRINRYNPLDFDMLRIPVRFED